MEGRGKEERGEKGRAQEKKREEDFSEEKNKLRALLYDANQNFHVNFNQTQRS